MILKFVNINWISWVYSSNRPIGIFIKCEVKMELLILRVIMKVIQRQFMKVCFGYNHKCTLSWNSSSLAREIALHLIPGHLPAYLFQWCTVKFKYLKKKAYWRNECKGYPSFENVWISSLTLTLTENKELKGRLSWKRKRRRRPIKVTHIQSNLGEKGCARKNWPTTLGKNIHKGAAAVLWER